MNTTLRSVFVLGLVICLFGYVGVQNGWFETGNRKNGGDSRTYVDPNEEGASLVEEYPDLDYVTAQQVSVLREPILVDMRPKHESATLRIAGSRSMPGATLDDLLALPRSAGQAIVLLGTDEASRAPFRLGDVTIAETVPGVFVFAGGVMEWAESFPERTELFGDKLDFGDLHGKVISDVEFAERCVSPDEAMAELQDGYQLVDVRDREARSRRPLQVPGIITSSFPEVVAELEERKDYPRSVFVDAYGRSVRYLQYHLERHGVRDYAFIRGGALTWYRSGYDRTGARAAPAK